MAQARRNTSGMHTLTPRVKMPRQEALALKSALALQGLAYNELVLTLTRQWLAARTQQETPPDGEGV